MNTPTHSEIVSKAAPSLYNGTVNPKRDYTTTPFTFTVIYQDADNDPPSYVRVWLNGLEYDMSKANPSDDDYTDGCEYSLTLYLSKGTYDYFFRASDGSTTVRDPPDYSAYSDLAVLNSGPSLYSGSVSPSSGYATTTFTYTVTYKDVDNDPPEYVKVQIDGVSWYMSKANPSDNDYTDGCVYTYSTTLNKGSHTYEFKASDGDIHAYLPDDYGYYNGPTVYNSGPVLSSGGVSPSSGSSTTTFTYTVTYTDADNDAPSYIRVYIDGNYYGMSKQDPGDSDYTDGCIYTYSTTLSKGNHNYYFSASDGSDSARLPSSGSSSGPTVVNSAPTLSSGGVSPSSGSSTTTFTYTVTYTDADNDAPSYIRVYIDGNYYGMSKQDPGDSDYTDGCIYTYSTTLSKGNHNYYFSASDGSDSARLPSSGSSSGPTVVNSAPTLSSGGVSPSSGYTTTIFTYTVTYADADNDAPSYVRVYIDGNYYSMSKQDPGDDDYTDGCVYTYSTTLSGGSHNYYFYTSDGSDSARLPPSGSNSGPTVEEPEVEIWGDTTIWNTIVKSNTEIILNGNLTIASGGSLTLTNVTLRINCTSNGSNHIEVQGGGALYINDTDGDPSTRGDATNITALNPNHRFTFLVRSGATFQMNNSELHHCGYTGDYPYTGAGLWINTNNTHVENNTLTNNHHGIILYYAHHNTLENNTATNNSGHGFYLYGSSNNTLENNTAANNSDDGFRLYGSSNNTLENNTATNNSYGFYLYGSSNNTFSGNTATNNGNDGFKLYYSSNNTFSNNTAADNGGDGLDMYGSDNNSFTNNLAQNNTGNGFWIDGDFNSFIGNTAINNGHGFLLIFALNNTLVNNIAEKNRGCGFYPSSSTDNTSFTGNIAKDNLRDGFEMHGSNSYFYNNEAINNSEYGFDFLVGPHFVSNNTANNNHWGGFRIYSNYNTLVNNKANNNTQYGFILWKANNNNLSSNEAINNGIYGFYLYNSTDNELPGNTAINNSVHGFYLDSLSINNDLTGSLEKNYVQVELRDLLNNLPVQGAEVKIEVDGETVYASPGFGGTNSTTDIKGLTGWILVPYRKFISGTVFVENETKVTMSYAGLYIVNNSRIVSVSTSHTETFFVDNVPPSVTITTPGSDTVTNFGPIYILGHFNGTGSRVQNIFCNDSRFDLLSSDLSEVGTFSFVNNTAIPTGDFWVNITVQDESGLVVFMLDTWL